MHLLDGKVSPNIIHIALSRPDLTYANKSMTKTKMTHPVCHKRTSTSESSLVKSKHNFVSIWVNSN